MKRRDFLKLSAAAALTGAAGACGAAPAASASSTPAAPPASSPAGPASSAAPAGAASLTTNEGDAIPLEALEHLTRDAGAPAVYFTREISAAALVRAYEALGWTPSGRVAVKLSTGEPPASNYLRPELVGDLVRQLDGTIVECNTAYGGAIKNISIGLGSREGKSWIHSGGTGGSMWSGEQDAFLEAMGDAGKSVSDALGHGAHIVYLNVMNRLSVDCDCDGNPAEPEMADIGILASTDPVALDQACIDLVYAAPGHEALTQRIESRNGIHTLESAEAIGLGSRAYRLELLDV